MGTTKAAQEYAETTLDEVEWLMQFIDGKPVEKAHLPSISQAENLFSGIFPATYINGDDQRGESLLFRPSLVVNEFWPFDFSAVLQPYQGRDFAEVVRVRSVSLKQASGKVQRMAPKILRMEYFFGREEGGILAGPQLFFGVYPNGSIAEITKGARFPEVSAIMESLAGHLASASVSSFYNWHVVLGKVGSQVKVKLPATPTSAREFLSLRDVPEGYQRRAAIKHWVSKHERRRETPEEYDVRAHLRGREEFTWGDYEGWVEPSQHDLKKAMK